MGPIAAVIEQECMDAPRAHVQRANTAARPATKRRWLRLSPGGQGLIEFAISLPVVLLMILMGIDFGRVFLGWVTLNQAVREAANFAAYNPDGWSPKNAGVVTEYERLITTEAAAINCVLPTPIPDPAFPSGNGIGDPAVVAITCKFGLITPLISSIVGQQLNVSASASFPIRSGVIQGVPVGSAAPGPTTSLPPASITPPPPPTETPIPMCTVPNLIGVESNKAVNQNWRPAGFDPNKLLFSPIPNPKYTIRSQSLPALSSQPCDSTMTVTPNP